jgi:hypothetical protein
MDLDTEAQNTHLNELFPSTETLIHLLVTRRSARRATTTLTQKDLTPSEQEFLTKCERRKEVLREVGGDEEQVVALRDMYRWEPFARELHAYVAKNWETIVESKGGKYRQQERSRTSEMGAGTQMRIDDTSADVSQSQRHSTSQQETLQSQVPALSESLHAAYNQARTTIPPSPLTPTPSTPVRPPASTPSSCINLSQTRRPWTQQERTLPHLRSFRQTNVYVEAALLAGLETVQAPNWAGILKLYGKGGTISEALKYRTQVQLKDKARNLKLMILKSGQPLPAVLGMVTGSIKGKRGVGAGEGEEGGMGRKQKKRKIVEGDVMSMAGESQASFCMEEWSSELSETMRN